MEYATLEVEDKDKTQLLENIALYLIIVVMFLLPIFFVPLLSVPFFFTKSFLIFVSVLSAFFLFLISKLKRGEISLPRNAVALFVWGLPLAYLISAIFSGNSGVSYLGQGFEIDTFGFMAIMALMLSLAPLLLKTRESVFKVHIAIALSLIILAVFQGLRLIFGADFLSFGIFTSSTSNILGKWNDLGIFFGLTAILSLITLEGLPLNKLSRLILYIILSVSVFFLIVVNFILVWITTGLFALGMLIYNFSKRKFKFSENDGEGTKNKPIKNGTTISSLIILIISLIFIIGGSVISEYASSFFNIGQIEARPSWQSTIDITKKTYNNESILFGSGPNTFVNQWTMYKPQLVNNTLFWNIDFSSGIGLVPTAFATTGILGGLAWIAFFASFIYSGFKNLIVSAIEDRASYYLSLSLFLSGLYLWVFTIIYIPNMVIVTLAFLLTGMYIASLRFRRGSSPTEIEVRFASNQRLGFITVLILTILILVSSASLYAVGKQYLSAVLFQRALILANVDGNLDSAETNVKKAISFGKNDRYHRLAAEINLARINNLLAQTDMPIEERREKFQTILAEAISNVQSAITIDKKNYQNWSMLGRVYGSVVPLGVEGAYESAKQAYEKAITLHPNSPVIPLTLARLELARDANNIDAAKKFIDKALEKKNNYTEAIFLLSQLEIQAGNIENAIKSAEAVVVIEPNNPVYFFQLGLLQSSLGNNEKAISAFEKAVALNSQYSNARYFLGLSYFRVGKISEAIEQFTLVSDLNPENEEVKTILENLKAGNDPFTPTTTPPQINTLPIKGE